MPLLSFSNLPKQSPIYPLQSIKHPSIISINLDSNPTASWGFGVLGFWGFGEVRK